MENHLSKFVGNIRSKIKRANPEELCANIGGNLGMLAPTAFALGIDPSYGISFAIPSAVASIVSETVVDKLNRKFSDIDQNKLRTWAWCLAGIPAAMAFGAVAATSVGVEHLASIGQMLPMSAAGVGAVLGGACAVTTGISCAAGYNFGKIVGATFDSSQNLDK